MGNQIRESLLRQKAERAILLSKEYISRDIAPFKDEIELNNPEIIKVILGPRRSGKSLYGVNLFRSREFIYINFDDQGLTQEQNHNELYLLVKTIYPNLKDIFLDEIQNLPEWELFVSLLYRQGYNIIITGSNSKLLSKELSSRLTGRYIEGKIFPFSFKEYISTKLKLSYEEIDKLLRFALENPYDEFGFKLFETLTSYLSVGGYPIVVTSDVDYRSYLETLFNAILFEDIVTRYSIRTSQELSNLAKYLLSLTAKEFTYTKLKNILGYKNVNTVKSYISYLDEAFLTFSVNRYDTKFKEQINSAKKAYIMDNGFISSLNVQGNDLQSRVLENQVFTELLRRNKIPNQTLFYYKTRNNKEIDFICKNEVNKSIDIMIQVCFSMRALETEKREISAISEASSELHCNRAIIITWDERKTIKEKDLEIRVIPLWEYLLDKGSI